MSAGTGNGQAWGLGDPGFEDLILEKKWRTRSLTSRPRAAMEVATSTLHTLDLKSEMVDSRSLWSLPPCSDRHG